MIPVCIFAKPPVPGEVKTRLIPVLGAVGAAQLAGAMLLDTWRTVASCPGVHPILATTRRGDLPMHVAPDDIWLQGEGDLGSRIERILTRGLLHAPAAIALGADSPALNASHIAAALEALRTHDAVVGPSIDGGFYLLALGRCPAGLFTALPWSEPGTLQALRQRLDEQAFTVADIETLLDVDTPEDLALLERQRSCA
jgi:rSAM/selenodomain-associated transferase 1